MAGFLRRFRKKAAAPPQRLELLAVEGDDAGERFTLDAAEIRIGRGRRNRESGRIGLRDATVSTEQALIRWDHGGDYCLEGIESATNPTLLNDQPACSTRLCAGDRIRMGRVVLEVREPVAVSVSDEGAPDTASFELSDTVRVDLREKWSDMDQTQVRPIRPSVEIELLAGLAREVGQRFAITDDSTLLGRSSDCRVRVEEPGVSRVHAELVWSDGALLLHHRSRVNPTLVNGRPVDAAHTLADGDRIQLADRVVLAVRVGMQPEADTRPIRIDPSTTTGAGKTTGTRGTRARTLKEYMEEKLEREEVIEREFRVVGSFLDVDVVGSYAMKTRETEAAPIVVSFERFRAFVADRVQQCGGSVLNSNGDELMCFFDSADDAVRAGIELLQTLPDFNEKQNRMHLPFRVRLGVHTGESLVDRRRGVAYSAILDVAGHLQKEAEVDGMRISGETFTELADPASFESAGPSDKDGIESYRLRASPVAE